MNRSRHLMTCFFAMAAIGGCGHKEAPPEPPRPVLTMVVAPGNQDSGAQYSGEIRSRTETPVGFRTGGKIISRAVDAGAAVRQGQELARLDPTDNAAQAASAQSQAELALAEVKRYRDLRNRNFVSQSALDAKETAYKSAKAQADIFGNQSAYTTLKAEYPGVIAQVGAEVGQVVSPGQMVFRLARPDQPEVLISIPETRVTQLKVGSPATVSLWVSDGNGTYQGKLRELSPMADGVTRTYSAKITVINPDHHIRLGMTANVSFAQVSEQITLPLPAIFQQDGKPAVWVVAEDSSVHLRPVVIGLWREEGATLTSGLKPGERVVIAGVHKLSAGEKIKIAEVQR